MTLCTETNKSRHVVRHLLKSTKVTLCLEKEKKICPGTAMHLYDSDAEYCFKQRKTASSKEQYMYRNIASHHVKNNEC